MEYRRVYKLSGKNRYILDLPDITPIELLGIDRDKGCGVTKAEVLKLIDRKIQEGYFIEDAALDTPTSAPRPRPEQPERKVQAHQILKGE